MLIGCSCTSNRHEPSSEKPAPEELSIEQTFVGKPARVAIDHFGVELAGIETHHHWGATLSAISFEVKKGEHAERMFLWVECNETPKRGFWDMDIIGNSKVTNVASETIDEEKSLLGQPAEVVVDHYKIRFDDVRWTFEPPSKVNGVYFTLDKGVYKEALFLWLEGEGLWSKMGRWDEQAIRKAKVVKITARLVFD
jgi:hypothetical protein